MSFKVKRPVREPLPGVRLVAQETRIPDTYSREELENFGIRILVGVPMPPSILARAATNFFRIFRHGWDVITSEGSHIELSRNAFGEALLADNGFAPKFTHLLMLDADHTHPEDVVERHARWVVGHPEREVIGGLHFRRGSPFTPCVTIMRPGGTISVTPDAWQEGLCQVTEIGHGTLLVARALLERLPRPWWFKTVRASEWVESGYTHIPEDSMFCEICRNHGVPLWCDTTITSPHTMPFDVDADSAELLKLIARKPRA